MNAVEDDKDDGDGKPLAVETVEGAEELDDDVHADVFGTGDPNGMEVRSIKLLTILSAHVKSTVTKFLP